MTLRAVEDRPLLSRGDGWSEKSDVLTMSPFLPLAYASVPTATAALGMLVAAYRPPRGRLRSYVQHLAAGVVFSVVAVELLPDIIHKNLPVAISVGFTLGVGFMLILKVVGMHLMRAGGGEESSASLLASVGVDVFIDGLLIALTFAAGARAGILLKVALALEMLSLGLAVTGTLDSRGYRRGRLMATTMGLFLLLPAGALIGGFAVPLLRGSLLEGVLSFGLAALLFLVTEELLVEAHEEGEIPAATALFFLGFLVFLLLGMNGE